MSDVLFGGLWHRFTKVLLVNTIIRLKGKSEFPISRISNHTYITYQIPGLKGLSAIYLVDKRERETSNLILFCNLENDNLHFNLMKCSLQKNRVCSPVPVCYEMDSLVLGHWTHSTALFYIGIWHFISSHSIPLTWNENGTCLQSQLATFPYIFPAGIGIQMAEYWIVI